MAHGAGLTPGHSLNHDFPTELLQCSNSLLISRQIRNQKYIDLKRRKLNIQDRNVTRTIEIDIEKS
jgi:hypothetical protein